MSIQGLIHKSTSTAEASGEGSRPGKRACDVCSMVSEFPRNRKTRKLRLHRPADVVSLKSFPDITVCSHYAAISYCWPESQQDEQGNPVMGERTYQVRDIDGKIRLNRALDDVLDRAVDFAMSCGVRMIWIDQECLPQPNEKSPQEQKEDQQLGIQAMDIVYSRASVTGGLISTQVTDQAQLDAVYMLTSFRAADVRGGMRWVGDTPPPVINQQILNHVLDFLEMVGRDRWYTRAWVVQEALCAGTKLLITLRRGPGISWPSEFRVPGRSAGDPLSTPHPPTPRNYEKFPSEIICIPIESFQSMVQAARFFLEHDFITMGNVLVRYGGEDSTTITREKRILDVAETLHPVVVQSKTQVKAPRAVGGNNHGERQTVDAAGALTLLHTRGCRDVQDRVAIVANMCNFETRLNTFDVARNCKSLRMALIALALLNGDCSILAPEAYRLGHVVEELLFSESLGESSHSAQIDTHSLVGYMDVVSRGIWEPEAEGRRAEGLGSAFDVDGPSLISTLYDGNWEVLPRPEIRSMSVCWVFEGVHYRKASTEEQVTSVRKTDPEGAMKTSEMEEDTDCAYKVLDKVKGLWKLMDYPLQQYTFI